MTAMDVVAIIFAAPAGLVLFLATLFPVFLFNQRRQRKIDQAQKLADKLHDEDRIKDAVRKEFEAERNPTNSTNGTVYKGRTYISSKIEYDRAPKGTLVYGPSIFNEQLTDLFIKDEFSLWLSQRESAVYGSEHMAQHSRVIIDDDEFDQIANELSDRITNEFGYTPRTNGKAALDRVWQTLQWHNKQHGDKQ